MACLRFFRDGRSTDADGDSYAGWHGGRNVNLRQMSDNSQIALFESSEEILGHVQVRFSLNRQYLAVRFRAKSGFLLNVWDIDQRSLILVARLLHHPMNSFDFTQDSRVLAIVQPDGSIKLLYGPKFQTSRILRDDQPARTI